MGVNLNRRSALRRFLRQVRLLEQHHLLVHLLLGNVELGLGLGVVWVHHGDERRALRHDEAARRSH